MHALPIPRARGTRSTSGWQPLHGAEHALEPALACVVAGFDGLRDAPALRRDFGETGEVDAAIRLAVAQGWLGEPDWVDLPVRVLGAARFRCLSCGSSCRNPSAGPLQPHDIERLLAVDLAALGVTPDGFMVERQRAGKTEHFLRKRDGHCVFLDPATNLCRVHALAGSHSKPMVCQTYPSRLGYVPGGVRLSLYGGCLQRHQTFVSGPLLSEQIPWVRAMQALGFGQTGPFPRWVLYLPEQARVELAPGVSVGWQQYLQIEEGLLAGLTDPELSPTAGLGGGLRWLDSLCAGAPQRLDSAPDAASASAGREVCRQLCGVFVALAKLKEDVLLMGVAGELSSAVELPCLSAEAEAMARELVVHELWSLRTLEPGGSVLAGLVLLSLVVVLAAALEPRVEGATVAERFNLAFYRAVRLLPILQLSAPEQLIPFARAPWLP